MIPVRPDGADPAGEVSGAAEERAPERREMSLRALWPFLGVTFAITWRIVAALLAFPEWFEGHLCRLLPRFMSQRPGVRDTVAGASRPASQPTLVAITKAALGGLLTGGTPVRARAPVLLACGTGEQRFVTRPVGAWAGREPAVAVQRVDGAGHFANEDNPAAFDAALFDLLRRHASDPRLKGV